MAIGLMLDDSEARIQDCCQVKPTGVEVCCMPLHVLQHVWGMVQAATSTCTYVLFDFAVGSTIHNVITSA